MPIGCRPAGAEISRGTPASQSVIVATPLPSAGRPVLDGRWLVVRLPGPHAVLSCAVANGGRRTADVVAWHEVRNAELQPPVDPARLLEERLSAAGLAGAVGLLTYAGMHTAIGHVVGAAVHAAVVRGAEEWRGRSG